MQVTMTDVTENAEVKILPDLKKGIALLVAMHFGRQCWEEMMALSQILV